MSLPLLLIDAFTDQPFRGNPAAVCLLEHEPPSAWMQSVAAEMNQAETAFVWLEKADFGLRWFTPTVEVDLCGHATLAAAHALWETQRLAPGEVAHFQTRSGLLSCRRTGEWTAMDFPAEPPVQMDTQYDFSAMLGADPIWTGRNRMDYFVQLHSGTALREITPDLAAIAELPARGLIVTARADTADYDFASRFFAPQAGVPEDHVTGSAHCALGPFWADRIGKSQLIGFQASSRGGFVEIAVLEQMRVELRGKALTVLTGTLAV